MPSGLPPGISESSPLGLLLARVGELIESGRFADAIAPLTEAAALRPDSPNILTDLGGLYLEADRPREALEPLQRALAINPRVAIAHWRLGAALQALGDFDGAIHALEQAIQIRPDLADAHYRLALLYGDRGRRCDALEAYRQAAQLTEEPAEKLFLEAQALVTEGREIEAEPLLRSALELDPALPTAHGLLGQILARAGKFHEAGRHIEAQLARSPRAGTGYYDLVRSRKITESDSPLLDRIDSLLTDESLDDRNRMLLLLARGKAMDDLGRHEEAMKSLDAASVVRMRVFSIRVEDFEKQVDDIVALFDAGTLKHRVSANPDRTPVLILGMPRSGTTLVEQIVSSHPDVSGGGELAFWRNRLPLVVAAGIEGLTGDFLERTAIEYLKDLRTISGAAVRVTDKDPFNFLAIGLIHLVFPQAAIVHCRRNPLDTAISIHQTHFSKSTGMPTGGEELVRYFRAYERLMAHWRQVLPQGRLLEIRYEQLVSWPQSEIRKVIDHLGMQWHPDCLMPHVNTSLVRTPSGFQVRQSINTESVDRWRRYEPWLGPLAALREEAVDSGQ